MKTLSLLWLIIVLAFFQGIARFSYGDVRQAAYQGTFYPKSEFELRRMLDKLMQEAERTQLSGKLRALILPHAGYIYSGSVASHGAVLIKRAAFDKVIIMGPDHRVGFTGCSVSSASAWQTPLGQVDLHDDARRLLQSKNLFHIDPVSEKQEHAVEVILPFVQAVLDDFTLVPVVTGRCAIEKTARKIDELIDGRTLLIASSDLSHYLPYDRAVKKDRQTIGMILEGRAAELKAADNAACGRVPLLMLMNIAQKRNWKPVLLHYANSGDTAGDRSRVVGYCAIAYVSDDAGPKHFSRLTQEQGHFLVQTARHTIAQVLGINPAQDRPVPPPDIDAGGNRATFVTLTLDGHLRGCIGSLQATEPVTDNIRHNALNAAFHDPRFPGLTQEEFKNLNIEVSILTPSSPLDYRDADDLLTKLMPFRDGVIIRKGMKSATFLPQVWKQLPKPEAFLGYLCQKAGLDPDEWQTGHLDVFTYQVQYFEEAH
nr:AmmeMemoRadiSam system protein B [uncultured Desulfobacter sp.]